MNRRVLAVVVLAVVVAAILWHAATAPFRAPAGVWGFPPGMGPFMMPGPTWVAPGVALPCDPAKMVFNARQASRDLSGNDVRSFLERCLAIAGNPRIKLGNVTETGDRITADIVTAGENALVDRLVIDRHTGFIQREAS